MVREELAGLGAAAGTQVEDRGGIQPGRRRNREGGRRVLHAAGGVLGEVGGEPGGGALVEARRVRALGDECGRLADRRRGDAGGGLGAVGLDHRPDERARQPAGGGEVADRVGRVGEEVAPERTRLHHRPAAVDREVRGVRGPRLVRRRGRRLDRLVQAPQHRVHEAGAVGVGEGAGEVDRVVDDGPGGQPIEEQQLRRRPEHHRLQARRQRGRRRAADRLEQQPEREPPLVDGADDREGQARVHRREALAQRRRVGGRQLRHRLGRPLEEGGGGGAGGAGQNAGCARGARQRKRKPTESADRRGFHRFWPTVRGSARRRPSCIRAYMLASAATPSETMSHLPSSAADRWLAHSVSVAAEKNRHAEVGDGDRRAPGLACSSRQPHRRRR